MDKIIIKGARTHNLKNISLELPRDKFIVVTGLSGSGKSSLAFDTIFAEGQRRYVESLSAYARQFLGQMNKPDVDSISGLSPAVAIEQKGPGYNPRSIVGTMTEIYDYLRVLFARVGILHCPDCGIPIARQSRDEIIARIYSGYSGMKTALLAPLVSARKGEYRDLFGRLVKNGFVRVRVDGNVYNLEEEIRLDKNKKHDIEIVVDRIEVTPANRSRVSDSLELALKEGGGTVIVQDIDRPGEEKKFSESMTCLKCGKSYGETEPRDFSFNNPFGSCPDCTGLGFKIDFDPALIMPDQGLSIKDGAISVPGFGLDGWTIQMMDSFAESNGFSIDVPVSRMKKDGLKKILYGSGGEEFNFRYKNDLKGTDINMRRRYEGVIPTLERRYRESSSEDAKREYEKYMRMYDCPGCGGKRLSKKALSVTIDGKNIYDICNMSIKDLSAYVGTGLSLDASGQKIAKGLLKEITERLRFMINVGLDYLNLFRRSDTLSGGEAQRINLATQIGAGLQGVLYVLDEPSIGLHQRDNGRLIETLLRLRDLGNTLIVVEHDEETILNSDWIVDMGPGAGDLGGKVVFSGTLNDLKKSKDSLTAQYINREMKIAVPERRKKPSGWLIIKNARENNLKKLDVKIPLGVFCCVTGVSGSGKSTLVNDILYRALSAKFYGSRELPGKHDSLTGTDLLDKVININQSPIGRTPRSNPVTYTGVFGHIRDLFAELPDSRARGFKPGRFSFNVRGGRCEACQGSGVKEIKMHFLPDVYIQCDVCKGRRFDSETLEVRFKGHSIFDVLEMTVISGLELFGKIPAIKRILSTLDEVGLGYIKLGQAATTLSGGEAQRVKLATYLSKRSTGRTLYILDEPTTGLHFADTAKLLSVLHRFVETGNTVLVIEHNLDVVKTADFIIDLGPEGGDAGGRIVAEGTPEDVMRAKGSFTGAYLAKFLNRTGPGR